MYEQIGPYRLEHRISRHWQVPTWIARGVFASDWLVVELVDLGAVDEVESMDYAGLCHDLIGVEAPGIALVEEVLGSPDGGAVYRRPYLLGESAESVIFELLRDERPLLSAAEAVAVGVDVCASLAWLDRRQRQRGVHTPYVHHCSLVDRVWLTPAGSVQLLGMTPGTRIEFLSGTGPIRNDLVRIGCGAPEWLEGAGETAASDVYEVGALLYSLTVGHPPFGGEDFYSMLQKARRGRPPTPSRVVPGYDRGLEAVVMRALSRDPDDRYPNAAALAEALNALGPSSPPPPAALEGSGLMTWLRAHLFDGVDAVASLFNLRPELAGEPVLDEYVWRHIEAAVRAPLEAGQAPRWPLLLLTSLLESGEEAAADWMGDRRLPPESRALLAWLVGEDVGLPPEVARSLLFGWRQERAVALEPVDRWPEPTLLHIER